MDKRLERLKAVVEGFGENFTPEQPFDTSSQEDLSELIAEVQRGRALPQFVAVTEGRTSTGRIVYYFYPCDLLAHAKDKAEENMHNDLFQELPVCVHDLDHDTRYIAELHVVWDESDEPHER